MRIGELDQATLAQRIEGYDRNAALHGVLQLVQHARARGADVLAEKENAVGMLEIVQRTGADWHSDTFGQRHGRRLVTHVRTVRQVVGAVSPRKEPVHKSRLQRSAAGSIEHGAVRSERTQLASNLLKSCCPLDRDIFVGLRVPTHGVRQAACRLQLVVIPAFQVRHLVLGEKLWRDALVCNFPGGRLGAILAKLKDAWIRRLGPGAAHAHEAARLVLLEQNAGAAEGHPVASQAFRQGLDRTPSSGRSFIGFDLEIRT